MITLSFNQELADDDVLTLSLACNNQIQDTGLPEVNPDGLVVTVTINTPVPKGNCFISWFLKDGLGATITQQTSSFGVTSEPALSGTQGSTATTVPFDRVPALPTSTSTVSEAENPGSIGGALWLGRVISTLSILVLFGSLALISIGWPEGPEYVVTVRFLRGVWIAGLLSTVLFVVAFAADACGSSLGSAMTAIRPPPGISNGGCMTCPPAACTSAMVASASSTVTGSTTPAAFPPSRARSPSPRQRPRRRPGRSCRASCHR